MERTRVIVRKRQCFDYERADSETRGESCIPSIIDLWNDLAPRCLNPSLPGAIAFANEVLFKISETYIHVSSGTCVWMKIYINWLYRYKAVKIARSCPFTDDQHLLVSHSPSSIFLIDVLPRHVHHHCVSLRFVYVFDNDQRVLQYNIRMYIFIYTYIIYKKCYEKHRALVRDQIVWRENGNNTLGNRVSVLVPHTFSLSKSFLSFTSYYIYLLILFFFFSCLRHLDVSSNSWRECPRVRQ